MSPTLVCLYCRTALNSPWLSLTREAVFWTSDTYSGSCSNLQHAYQGTKFCPVFVHSACMSEWLYDSWEHCLSLCHTYVLYSILDMTHFVLFIQRSVCIEIIDYYPCYKPINPNGKYGIQRPIFATSHGWTFHCECTAEGCLKHRMQPVIIDIQHTVLHINLTLNAFLSFSRELARFRYPKHQQSVAKTQSPKAQPSQASWSHEVTPLTRKYSRSVSRLQAPTSNSHYVSSYYTLLI